MTKGVMKTRVEVFQRQRRGIWKPGASPDPVGTSSLVTK